MDLDKLKEMADRIKSKLNKETAEQLDNTLARAANEMKTCALIASTGTLLEHAVLTHMSPDFVVLLMQHLQGMLELARRVHPELVSGGLKEMAIRAIAAKKLADGYLKENPPKFYEYSPDKDEDDKEEASGGGGSVIQKAKGCEECPAKNICEHSTLKGGGGPKVALAEDSADCKDAN